MTLRWLIAVSLLCLCSTFCRQTLTFIGVCTGESGETIWITENVDGECSFTQLLQVTVHSGDSGTCISSYCENDVVKTKRLFDVMMKENISSLHPGNDKRFMVEPGMSFAAPASDSRLDELYRKGSFYNAVSWRKAMGDSAIQSPQFIGMHATLAYAYPVGLYINYRITSAAYVPDSRLLILFTSQSLLADGGDTMDGFLVYRLRK